MVSLHGNRKGTKPNIKAVLIFISWMARVAECFFRYVLTIYVYSFFR